MLRTELKALLFSSDRAILKYEGPLFEKPVETVDANALMPGLVLVMQSKNGDRQNEVNAIDRDGKVIHSWPVVWSDIWPDDEGDFPWHMRPASNDGTMLHGLALLPDGSIVANFEYLSTFRLDACGNIVWKLANFGHHSVFYDKDSQTIWVTTERDIRNGETGFTNHVAPLNSWMIQHLSLDGKVLDEFSVIDVLQANGLEGLIYLSSVSNENTQVTGDTLHLNDVDIFPQGQESDLFKPGDLMFSLRNINAIFVIDPETKKIKFMSIGRVLRHHDPDFEKGDIISVFNNRNLEPSVAAGEGSSQIVEINAKDGTARVALEGKGDDRFYSGIMGNHQHLANGNWLVNSSAQGRVLEFGPDGKLLWRYSHRISDTANARIYYAGMVPPSMDAEFFRKAVAACKK